MRGGHSGSLTALGQRAGAGAEGGMFKSPWDIRIDRIQDWRTAESPSRPQAANRSQPRQLQPGCALVLREQIPRGARGAGPPPSRDAGNPASDQAFGAELRTNVAFGARTDMTDHLRGGDAAHPAGDLQWRAKRQSMDQMK